LLQLVVQRSSFLFPAVDDETRCPLLTRRPLRVCPQAEERVARHGWGGLVDVVVADACDEAAAGLPPSGTVDVVTFSYALTMIPDWQKAVANAKRLLKPGGHLCVCDFTVDDSQWYGMNTFWRKTFATDHVFLRPEHRPFLRSQFKPVHEDLGYGTFPYVPPVLQCPWYVFIGQKA
jgi:S-adenosylmethionine-diacylgycerolhomoserine-N-methlytransferase